MKKLTRVGIGRSIFAGMITGVLAAQFVLTGPADAGSDDWDTSLALVTSSADGSIHDFVSTYKEYAAPSAERGYQLNLFTDALIRIRESYVSEVEEKDLIKAAIKGIQDGEGLKGAPPRKVMEGALDAMVASLDAHSSYLNDEEFNDMLIATRGEFGGLGIEVTTEDDYVKVVAPIEDTPAERAGIKPADLITHVDGMSIKGFTLTKAVRRMRGKPGTDILLTIQREGKIPFDVTITRDIIQVRPVKWRLEGKVGYIRVRTFSGRVEDGIEDAVDEIKNTLGDDLRGVVLDLRNNPGGLLDQSIKLSDMFVGEGPIVSVRGRLHDDRIYRADSDDEIEGVPMVVLVNGGSASASEIVAGALQDHKRAVVMGTKTFGKGSVQTIIQLNKGALRLTTARYYLPSGRSIQASGLVPDLVLTPPPPEDGEEKKKVRSEATLPGALKAEPVLLAQDLAYTDMPTVPQAQMPEEHCPAVGEKKDRGLGCALMYLREGRSATVTGFVAKMNSLRGGQETASRPANNF